MLGNFSPAKVRGLSGFILSVGIVVAEFSEGREVFTGVGVSDGLSAGNLVSLWSIAGVERNAADGLVRRRPSARGLADACADLSNVSTLAVIGRVTRRRFSFEGVLMAPLSSNGCDGIRSSA
ncbi:MAG: hypothetical protein V1784_10210 [bacterium]